MLKRILIFTLIFFLPLTPYAFTEEDVYRKEFYGEEWKSITQDTTGVEFNLISDNIAYLKILFFTWQTGTEMQEVFQQIIEKKIDNVVLDLRDNQGGVIYSAIEVSKLFVKKGEICTINLDDGTEETFSSELEEIDFKLILLVNGMTASSAEILASAIKDSESGILVGHKTYGKNSIQQIKYVDDRVIQNTIGRFLTRNGENIKGKGITPDYNIYNTMELLQQFIEGKEEYVIVTKDNQLDFALELLSEENSAGGADFAD